MDGLNGSFVEPDLPDVGFLPSSYGQAAPDATALEPSEGAPGTGRPSSPSGAPPDGYQQHVLGPQPQKLPSALAALTANKGPGAGGHMSAVPGQARGLGQQWTGPPLAPQMPPQSFLPHREIVGLPDQVHNHSLGNSHRLSKHLTNAY